MLGLEFGTSTFTLLDAEWCNYWGYACSAQISSPINRIMVKKSRWKTDTKADRTLQDFKQRLKMFLETAKYN